MITLVSGAGGTASDRSSGLDGRTGAEDPAAFSRPATSSGGPVFPSTVRRLTLLPLTLALTLVFAGSASAATNKSIWGPLVLPNGQSAGPVYRSLGVDDLQIAVGWDTVAPTQPANPRNHADPA